MGLNVVLMDARLNVHFLSRQTAWRAGARPKVPLCGFR